MRSGFLARTVLLGAIALAPLLAACSSLPNEDPPATVEIDPYVIREIDGGYLADRWVHEWVGGEDDAFGPLGDQMLRLGFGEGIEHFFTSPLGDEFIVVEVRDYHDASGVPWSAISESEADRQLANVGEYEAFVGAALRTPDEGWVGYHIQVHAGRFLVEVRTFIDTTGPSAANRSGEPAEWAKAKATAVAIDQIGVLPTWQDENINYSEGLRLGAVARTAFALIFAYGLLWLMGITGSWRRTLAFRIPRVKYPPTVDGFRLVGREVGERRRASRAVMRFGAAGFVTAIVVEWWINSLTGGWQPDSLGWFPGSALLWIAGWLVGLAIGRGLTGMTAASRLPGYRSKVGTVRTANLLGLASLIGLAILAAFLVDMGSAILTVGLAPGETDAEAFKRTAGALIVGSAVVMTQIVIVYRWMQRRSRLRVKSFVEQDPRQSILFLRSFRDDPIRVASRRSARHSLYEYVAPRSREPFSEVVAWSLWRYGPVVAIGEPGEPMTMLGPALEYYDDDTWQDAVRHHAATANMIAITAGLTHGLHWELSLLKSHGFLQKTMVLFPPASVVDFATRFASVVEALDVTVDDDVAVSWPAPMALVFDENACPVIIADDPTQASAWEAVLDTAADQVVRNYESGAVPAIAEPVPPTPPRGAPPRRLERLIPRPLIALVAISLFTFAAMTAGDTGDETMPVVDGRSLEACAPARELALVGSLFAVVCRNEVAVGDWERGTTETLRLPGNPYAVAVIDPGRLLISDQYAPVVYEVATDPVRLVRTIDIANPSYSIAVADARVYMASPMTGTIDVYDGETLDPMRSIDVGGIPAHLAYAPGSGLYVADVLSGALLRIDIETNQSTTVAPEVWGIGRPKADPSGLWVTSRFDDYALRIENGKIRARVETQTKANAVVTWVDSAIVSYEQGDVELLLDSPDRSEPTWIVPIEGAQADIGVSNGALIIADMRSNGIFITEDHPESPG